MRIRLEKNKQPGICYAMANDGLELPIIDITHPAFSFDLSPSQLADLYDPLKYQMQKHRGFIERRLFQFFMKRSILGRALCQANGTFLTGMSTYLMKLGEKNLGTYAGSIDRKIAQSLPAISLRLRLQDMARLMADGLVPLLANQPGQPLHLINIAGGPAMDSLNALMLCPKDLLIERPITIHVLDGDIDGPQFGERALFALLSSKSKIEGLSIKWHRVPYNWSEPGPLQVLINELLSSQCFIVASSEGGLFEYGSDEDILANLRALSQASLIAGSVARPDRPAFLQTIVSVRLRPLDEFKQLIVQTGWSVDRALERPLSYNLIMKYRSISN